MIVGCVWKWAMSISWGKLWLTINFLGYSIFRQTYIFRYWLVMVSSFGDSPPNLPWFRTARGTSESLQHGFWVASHEHNFGEAGHGIFRPGRRAAECPLMPEPWADLELAVLFGQFFSEMGQRSMVKSRVKIVYTIFPLYHGMLMKHKNSNCIHVHIHWTVFSNNNNPIPLLLNTT